MSDARPAVILATVRISDPEAMNSYYAAALPLLAAAGGVVLATGKPEPIEGQLEEGSHLLATLWPSIEAARSFWMSDAYARAKALRAGCCTVIAVLQEASGEAIAMVRDKAAASG